MNIYFKNITKLLFTNIIILLSFIILLELIFGYWFDEDNLGPYMREHRMKNQPTSLTYKGKTYNYNYKRNYYGFRGDEIKPSNIKAIIMGGSVIDERYKPEEFTITGYLNKNLKENNYNLQIVNAGIEAQSTVGIIYSFKHWFPKLKDFKPEIILLYIGVNDLAIPPNKHLKDIGDGHIKNPENFEVIKDNIKSRSIILDSLRIIKFKYLPKKNFVKYDGNLDPELENNFNYISYESALKKYDINMLRKKHKKWVDSYLSRVDILYNNAKKLNATPIFITNIGSDGYRESIFIHNYSLIEHCKIKKYNCMDLAKKIEGKYFYWSGGAHTTKEGSEEIANLISQNLSIYLKEAN